MKPAYFTNIKDGKLIHYHWYGPSFWRGMPVAYGLESKKIMRMKLWLILLMPFIVGGCTSAMSAASGSRSSDDLYSKRSDKLSETYSYDNDYSYDNSYEMTSELSNLNVSEASVKQAVEKSKPGELVTSYETSLNKRIAAMTEDVSGLSQSYWDYLDKYAQLLTGQYDPELYNVIIIGKEIWVEPKYLTAMFDGSTDLTIKTKEVKKPKNTQTKINVNINLGYDWYPYTWGSYWGNPYWGPSWGWHSYGRPYWGYYGYYDPWWGPSPWYRPYYRPYYDRPYHGRDVIYGSRRGGVGSDYRRPSVDGSGTGYRSNIRRESVGGSGSAFGTRRPGRQEGVTGTGTGYRRPATGNGSTTVSPSRRPNTNNNGNSNSNSPTRRDNYERQNYDRPTYNNPPSNRGGGFRGGGATGGSGGGGGGTPRGGRR